MSLKVSDVTLRVTQSKRQDLNCDVRRSGSVAFKVRGRRLDACFEDVYYCSFVLSNRLTPRFLCCCCCLPDAA